MKTNSLQIYFFQTCSTFNGCYNFNGHKIWKCNSAGQICSKKVSSILPNPNESGPNEIAKTRD